MSLSTHVLDATSGTPAAGVAVTVEHHRHGEWYVTGKGETNADGRIGQLGDPPAGEHRIRFATGPYFAAAGVATFYPEVTIAFTVTDASAHHHVPLLLSPFAFSTYRGS